MTVAELIHKLNEFEDKEAEVLGFYDSAPRLSIDQVVESGSGKCILIDDMWLEMYLKDIQEEF